MQCNCGEAKLVTVKKEGPNTGRRFYACAKPQGEQCDFFCWEGETPRAVKARVQVNPQVDSLQSKALAQIQAQLNRIESKIDAITPVNAKPQTVIPNQSVSKDMPF